MTTPEPSSNLETSSAARAGARYGMSLVATLLGAYMLINSPYPQFVTIVLLQHQADLAPLLLSQYLLGVVVLVFGALIAPASIGRRAAAAAVEVVAILVYAVTAPLFLTGGLNAGRATAWLSGGFFGAAFLITLSATAAWLILRSRPGWTLVFLVVTVIIPIVAVAVVFIALPSSVYAMLINVLVTVIGVGIAWLARAVAGSRVQPIG
jgi:hypothetical protein